MYEDIYSPDETIRKIIGKNKIKYSVMSNLIEGDIHNLKTFIINGDSILIELHKFLDQNKDISGYEYMEVISSSIINIIAHYRYYFSLNGWYPKIFFLADRNDDNSTIRESMEVVSMILKYIDNTYFIDTTNLSTGVIIKYFLKTNKENLILTRDDFDIMHISKSTCILRSNKDKSKFYSYHNWQEVLIKNYQDEYSTISHELINMILCFSGAHGRAGVKGLGYRTMLKKLANKISKSEIVNGSYSSIHDFIHDMGDSFKKYDLSNAIANFSEFDVNTNYSKFITKATEKRLDNYIEDKFSKKDLMMLNTRYFTGFNSLMLEELMTRPISDKGKSKW